MTNTDSNSQADRLEPMPWSQLQPYFSVVVLEYTGPSAEHACQQVIRTLRSDRTRRVRQPMLLVAEETWAPSADDSGLEEIHSFVHRIDRNPTWLPADSPFTNTEHALTLVMRQRNLVAIHADDRMKDRLQRWLDTPPLPMLRRIPALVLEACLLQGEAKGLWLRGTHAPRSSRPDSKNISGKRLQDAFNTFEDASFAMASARAALPGGTDRTALFGTIGTTPQKSLVWLKKSSDWPTFLAMTEELFDLIDDRLSGPAPTASVYTVLAREVRDLSEVQGAFEMSVLAPDDIPSSPGASDDLREAAMTLQNAILNVRGEPASARFEVDVGVDGAITGTLAAKLQEKKRGGFGIRFGLSGNPRGLFTADLVEV